MPPLDSARPDAGGLARMPSDCTFVTPVIKALEAAPPRLPGRRLRTLLRNPMFVGWCPSLKNLVR